MKRRELIALLGGAMAAWPLAARAQQSERLRRVGVLIGVADDAQGQARLAAFRKGMQDLGWSEGRNIRFDIRFSEGDSGRARAYAAELLALAPDAILANTAPVVSALQQQTRTIPIVFVQVLDPVSSGFVESLARPGGNVTGFSGYDFGLGVKWLELLKDVAPNVTKVCVLRDPTIPGGSGALGAIQAVASWLKVELVPVDVREEVSIQRGLAALAGATSGGLISYGSDNLAEWRQAASYVDRILKGANPADLPVQQPTKYELVVNLKTAKTLGLEIPSSVLARADEVIE